LASLNQLSNLSILAANSVIGGSINIGQTGSTSGQCQLQNNMSAAASATAMASNSAQSGKDKKGQKKGSSAIIITVVGIFVVLVIIFIISKLYTSERDSNVLTSEKLEAARARAVAGCMSGEPIKNAQGQIVIDPDTNHAICPHVPLEMPSPQIPMVNPVKVIFPKVKSSRSPGSKSSSSFESPSSASEYGSPSSVSGSRSPTPVSVGKKAKLKI